MDIFLLKDSKQAGLPQVTGQRTSGYIPTNNAPYILQILIKGTVEALETVHAEWIYADPEFDLQGASTYQWYVSDDSVGTGKTAISGATSRVYTISASYASKYLSIQMIPVAQTGITPGTVVESPLYVIPALNTNAQLYKATAGITITTNNVFKLSSAAGYGYGCRSNKYLSSGSGYVEITATETNKSRLFGLSNNIAGYELINGDWMAWPYSDGRIYFQHNSTAVGGSTAYSTGDKIRVNIDPAINSGRPFVTKDTLGNGVFTTIYSFTAGTVTYPLWFVCNMFTFQSTLSNIQISGSNLVKDVILKDVRNITNSNTYDGFGQFYQIDFDTWRYIFRSATNHLDMGQIHYKDYTYSTQSWGLQKVLYIHPDLSGFAADIRDPSCVKIGTDIFVFFAVRSRDFFSAWVGMYYIKSTDGGITYGSPVSLTTTLGAYVPYGEGFAGQTAGEYFVPFYEEATDNSGVTKVSLYRTTDSGANWSVVNVYTGTGGYNETFFSWIGGNNYIGLARKQPGGSIYQTVSTDAGVTWSAFTATNLVTSGLAMCSCLYDTATAKIHVIIGNRGNGYIEHSYNNTPATIIASAVAWVVPTQYYYNVELGDSINLGYSGIKKMATGIYLLIWTKQYGDAKADLISTLEDFL
jgi:hypothetical protein